MDNGHPLVILNPAEQDFTIAEILDLTRPSESGFRYLFGSIDCVG